MERGNVALQGAVGFDGDKATLRPQTLPLVVDDLRVVGVHFWDDHGHVGGPAMSAVVGNDRALQLSVGLLQGADLILLHVNSAEDKING